MPKRSIQLVIFINRYICNALYLPCNVCVLLCCKISIIIISSSISSIVVVIIIIIMLSSTYVSLVLACRR